MVCGSFGEPAGTPKSPDYGAAGAPIASLAVTRSACPAPAKDWMKAEANCELLTEAEEVVERFMPAPPEPVPFSGAIVSGMRAPTSTENAVLDCTPTLAMLPMPSTETLLSLLLLPPVVSAATEAL